MSTSPFPLYELLRLRRVEVGYDLGDVESATKISRHYLQAIEEKKFAALPSAIYTKNFLRSYTTFLGIDDDDGLADFLSEFNDFKQQEETGKYMKHCLKNTSTKSHDLPKILRRLTVSVIVAIIISYMGLEIRNIFVPPSLTILQPKDDAIFTRDTMTIVGQTEPEALVKINDEEILPDAQARFTKEVRLQDGINIITIRAKKKHSKEMTVKRHILYAPEKTKNFVDVRTNQPASASGRKVSEWKLNR